MANEPTKLDISDEMIAERRGGSGQMPKDMPKWMALTITKIDLASKWIGNVVCWITIPLIFAMVYEVLARKLFTAPTMWAYDMSRFLYGALFMLGAGYALSKGVHIRADFLYRNFKTKTQGLIDFWLYLLFYFPGLIVFLYMTTGFVQESIMRGEKGMDTAWMPYMWPIKACLWLGIIFLLVQEYQNYLKVIGQPLKVSGQEKKNNVSRIYRSSYFRFYFNWCNAFFNFCWISNIIYFNFFRFCFWLFGVWKISILSNDLAVFNGHDRTNLGCRPTLCLYGHNDGTSWINGKIIFCIPIDVSKS